MQMHLDPFAIVVAALASFLVGGLWYSPVMFARAWQRLCGVSDAELKRGVGAAFSTGFVCALVEAATLSAFIGDGASVGFAALAGALAGIGWVAPGLATTYAFERRPRALAAIDAGYHVVTLTVMGLVLGAWP